MNIRVKNGTGAGRKPPMRERSGPWFCKCPANEPFAAIGDPEADGVLIIFRERPGYLVRCPDCGAGRP